MYSNEINKQQLSEAARELLILLEKYQESNSSVGRLLARKKALLQKAINGDINAPVPGGFFPEELWEDGDLYEFTDLGDTAAKFSLLLKGATLEGLDEIIGDIERHEVDDDLFLKGLLANNKN